MLERLEKRLPVDADIQWNVLTGTPSQMIGLVDSVYRGSPEQIARSFLTDHHELFSMQPGVPDLELVSVRETEGVRHVRFRQTYQGVPLIETQYLVHVRSSGKVDMVNGTYYPYVKANTTPSLAGEAAAELALRALPTPSRNEHPPTITLKLLPAHGDAVTPSGALVTKFGHEVTRSDGETGFKLVWEVKLLTIDREGGLGEWEVLIDATSGDVVDVFDRTQWFVDPALVNRSEAVMPASTEEGQDAPVWSFARTWHQTAAATIVGRGTVYPDHPLISSPTQVDLPRLYGNDRLEGSYSNVHRYGSSRVTSSAHQFHYAPLSEEMEQTHLYYHTDRFRGGILNDLGFTHNIGSDPDIEAYTSEGGYNAFYQPSRHRIGFGYDIAFDDAVIYHEFTHAFVDEINNSITNSDSEEGAVSEGLADYFSATFTGRPELGEWFVYNAPDHRITLRPELVNNGWVRNAAAPEPAIYPGPSVTPNGEHDWADLFSAVLWDLRNSGSITVDRADGLVYGAIGRVDNNVTFLEYRDAMIAQDNAAYGGANGCAIRDAFGSRGIGASGFAAHVSGSGALQWGQTGSWNASTSCAPGSVSYAWHFREDGSPSSQHVGSGSSVSMAAYASGTLTVTASAGGRTATKNRYVYVNPPGCTGLICPFSKAEEPALSAPSGPDRFEHFGAFPNPSASRTEVRFALPEHGQAKLIIYDATGREVARQERAFGAGHHAFTWEPATLPSGVYLYRLRTDAGSASGRFVRVD